MVLLPGDTFTVDLRRAQYPHDLIGRFSVVYDRKKHGEHWDKHRALDWAVVELSDMGVQISNIGKAVWDVTIIYVTWKGEDQQ